MAAECQQTHVSLATNWVAKIVAMVKSDIGQSFCGHVMIKLSALLLHSVAFDNSCLWSQFIMV